MFINFLPKISKSRMNLSNRLALFSLIVSFLSLIIAALSYFQYFQDQKEMLSIDVKRIYDGEIKLTEYTDIDNLGHVIQMPWRVIISNLGNKKASVIEFKIENIHLLKADSNQNETSIFFGVNGGLFNLDGVEVQYPIILEGGESRIFTAYAGILTKNKVYEILQKNSVENMVSLSSAKKILGNENTDFFGNNAKLYELENGYCYIDVDPKRRKLYSYVFEFTTGKKKHVPKLISEYIN
jgi:hypothetical protein